MNTKNIFIILLATVFFLSLCLNAQEKVKTKPDETKAEVPALDNFHDVIYKLWHTAWPEKDMAMLVELLPEVQQGGDALANAELPGILRDKKTVWKENIGKLQAIINEYKKSVSPVDSQRLLDAAEKLHMQYEKLVRIVRPALKEMDEFHTVLYSLYHYYLPESNKNKITESTKELTSKMEKLNKAKLPDRLKKKEATFTETRTRLSKSIEAVNKAVTSGEMKTIKTTIELMHTEYQALEKVFE